VSSKKDHVMLKLCFAIVVLLIECDKKNKNPNCEKFEQVPVVEADAPISGMINQDIPVKVSFVVFSGCGQFGRFEESVEKNLVRINTIAKYSGCICTADIPMRKTTYHFRTSTPGVYILQFEGVRDAPAVTDTITIE
jgi:hypothetical protein